MSPDGDRRDWSAVAPDVIRDALAHVDPPVADDDRRPIRFACARVGAGAYLQHRLLFLYMTREP